MGEHRALALTIVVPAILMLAAVLWCPLMTLASLEQVDDHPLYVMRYYGPYTSDLYVRTGLEKAFCDRMRQMVMLEAGTWFIGTVPGIVARR